MLKKISGLLIVVLWFSCNQNVVFDKYQSIGDVWDKDNPIEFNFTAPDSTQSYNLFINLRNNNNYKFSNLFLIAELNYPNGKTLVDTLEYQMAKPSGEFLGTGAFSLKENKLWYKGFKEPFVFNELGNYQLKIFQAMRQNGSVDGVKLLDGVTDVGFRIEPNISE
ncbi:gliding motility lipoprotein GldH [Paucihalobacter ruber]|uniref:Gliding motility lipoprotein GldH n=1 Tax=Paucihalobacter ruber TaxID=2567861 RepID=A0A506PMB0_9FLAO|nr:gliding motility lipoprotein GldH [Paucihalobacter ruber]TPV35006.1 gliding motility lipoprotein GldH [Paucihalobacter ruber]